MTGIPICLSVSQWNNSMVSLGNGDGTFQSPISVGAINQQDELVSSADFNSDGKADLASSAGNVFVDLGDGTGHFSAPVGFQTDYAPRGLACADFNADENGYCRRQSYLSHNICNP